MNNFLVNVCTLILLPIIPAALMFKLFRNQGKGEGSFFGFKWSFGGAFAGYLIILLVLWAVMQKQIQPRDAEVWTVSGSIEAGETHDISNRVQIKSIPQSLRIEEDGGYEFKVIVLRRENNLEFPRIKIDLTRLCGGIKTVPLDDTPGTFESISNIKPIKVNREETTRSIRISPIELPISPKNDLCKI